MNTIVTAPNPVLSQTAKKITSIDNTILKIIEDMKIALSQTRDPEGVGLAAPQIGKSVQIFIIKPTAKSKVEVFINPVLEIPSDNKPLPGPTLAVTNRNMALKRRSSTKLEGCLSLPKIWGVVKRQPQITLSYIDENGKPSSRDFSGFPATIVQHEYDHLQGVLFPKRVLEQKGTLYKSYKNKKGEDEFEELDI